MIVVEPSTAMAPLIVDGPITFRPPPRVDTPPTLNVSFIVTVPTISVVSPTLKDL